MRNGERNIFYPKAVGNRARRAGQFQRGLATGFAHHLDVDPTHAARPSGPEGFHRGFLRSEPSRKSFGAVAMSFAVADFRGGEKSL